MSWLKRIGLDLLKALPIILGLGPGVLQAFTSPNSTASIIGQKVLGDLNGIPQLIVTAEAMVKGVEGSPAGSAKLAAVAPFVQQLIVEYAAANLPGSPKVKDSAKLAAAASQIASGFADALNAFGE